MYNYKTMLSIMMDKRHIALLLGSILSIGALAAWFGEIDLGISESLNQDKQQEAMSEK